MEHHTCGRLVPSDPHTAQDVARRMPSHETDTLFVERVESLSARLILLQLDG